MTSSTSFDTNTFDPLVDPAVEGGAPDAYNRADDNPADNPIGELTSELAGQGADGESPGLWGGRAATRGLTKSQVRRIAVKAAAVAEADQSVREVAATLLAVGTGIAELTTAIMTAPRTATQPINDLNLIASSDPMEAGVNATALGRPRLKNVWTLLAALGAGPAGNMPGSDAKAAISVARTALALSADLATHLGDVDDLLKKN